MTKQEEKQDEKITTGKTEKPEKTTRQIIIETDGDQIKIVKADVAGKIELTAILQMIINNIDKL